MAWPSAIALLNNSGTGFGNAGTIDAATEQFAFIGRVWWPDRADTSKDISHIHFRAGAVASFNASSQYRVSLQDVSLTAGPPLQPDGVVDQSFTSAAGVGPTANSWNRVALDTNRTVTPGELLAVVFDYAAFTSTSSIVIQAPFTSATMLRGAQLDCVLYTGSWAVQAYAPDVILEFSDGTYGTFYQSMPATAANGRTFNSGSTGSGGLTNGDERGLEYTPDVTVKADGCFVDMQIASGGNCELVLYEGTTVVETITIDSNAINAASSYRRSFYPFSQQRTLTAATLYRLMLKPTTANNVSLSTVSVDNAAYAVLFFGDNCAGNSRTDGGTFGTASTTEIPVMGFIISSIDDGAGGGASGPAHIIGG